MKGFRQNEIDDAEAIVMRHLTMIWNLIEFDVYKLLHQKDLTLGTITSEKEHEISEFLIKEGRLKRESYH